MVRDDLVRGRGLSDEAWALANFGGAELGDERLSKDACGWRRGWPRRRA